MEIEPKLREIVDAILAKLPAEDRASNVARAKALESYLRDGEFTYSLRMSVVDPGLDPVLDFLINRKQGHCEYFASALTLMCRLPPHPGPHGQRLQGRRLERHRPRPPRPREARP